MKLRHHDLVCREAVALISDYLDGALRRRDRRRLERHLADCDGCAAYLDQMRATLAITGSVGPDDVSDEALDALTAIFEKFRDERDG